MALSLVEWIDFPGCDQIRKIYSDFFPSMLSISTYICCLLGIAIHNVVSLSVWPDCFTWKVLAGPMSSYYINPFTQRSKDDLIFASVGCVDCKAFFEDSKSNIMQNLFALEKILALARFEQVPVEMKISKTKKVILWHWNMIQYMATNTKL